MITDYVNDEQLLQMCLELQNYQDFDMDGLSGEIVTIYAIEQLGTIDFNEDDVSQKISEIVTDFVLESLVKKGIVEAEIGEETTFKLTELGKRVANDERL
jgi:hypothetical protein